MLIDYSKINSDLPLIFIVCTVIFFFFEKINFLFLSCGAQNKGIYNSRITKLGYKTDLRIMTSQTELLTLIFFNFWS